MKKLLLLFFLLTISIGQSQTAAPTQPPRNSWDVISVFAGAYTDVAGTDFNPNWGQAGGAPVWPSNMTTPSYGGDAVKQYQNSGTYQGTRLGADIDVSVINKLHVDIYSSVTRNVRLFLIKTTGGSFETPINVSLTAGAWTSVDVTVNSTTFPGLDLTKIREIKYDQLANNQILIIDNFYFWRDATTLPLVLGFETAETGGPSGSFGGMAAPVHETGTGTNTTRVLKIVTNTGGDIWQGSNFNLTAPVQLTTTKTMTIDVKASGPMFFLVKVNGGVSGAPEAAAVVSYTGTDTWQTCTFTFNSVRDDKAAAANGVYNNFVIHPYWESASQTNFGTLKPARTLYVDNIRGPLAPVIALPPAAPTPPTRNSWDVVSLYSGSYTSTAGAVWQQGIDVPLLPGNNNARYFNGFTLARLAFAARSIATMTTLHIDVYTLNQSQLWFEINSNRKAVSSVPLNGWVSFDIPLTDFVGLNLANVSFFDLNNPNGAEAPARLVYLDNIYFYRPATDTPPNIGALTVPSPKVLGDAPFTLTNPSSNSGGAWSYSASPAGIVTFSGNTVTIVGGGTTTITATQAAVPGAFGPGIATATLVVNFPDPGPSPIPPARDPARVISMYTGTPSFYTNAPNYNLGQAFWSTGGGRVLTEISNGTNTALRIDGLGFMGLIDIGNPPPLNRERRLNLVGTGMSHLNIDIYLDTPKPNLFLILLAPSDRLYNTGPLAAGWNRLRVPLTAYPGALNDIYGLKIEQNFTSSFRLFVDNIYFSNDLFTFYRDLDGDTYGNAASTILAETAPAGYVSNNTDCDDTDGSVWRTGTFYVDFDSDGYHYDNSPNPSTVTLCYGATLDYFYIPTTLGVDCDDFQADRHQAYPFFVDADGDGYGSQTIVQLCAVDGTTPPEPNYSINDDDCDDTQADRHQTYPFFVDADGDGFGTGTAVQLCAVDGSTPPVSNYSVNNTDCDDTQADRHETFPFFVDADGDGYGTGTAVPLCAVDGLTPPVSNYSVNDTDCDDTNDGVWRNASFYTDVDGDGYDDGSNTVILCYGNTVPTGYNLTTLGYDCDDTQADRHQDYPFYVDADGDGYGAGDAVPLCAVDGATPPAPNYSANDDDCDDTTAAINPSVAEIQFDGIDNDCDGSLFTGFAPIVVNINSSVCGSVNNGLNNQINCNAVSVPGYVTTGYQFEITNTDTGDVDIVFSSQHHFKLTNASNYAYGTLFSIRVAAVINGEVQAYSGSTCTLTTKSVGTTQVIASQCGSTLIAIGSTIYANTVASTNLYKFRVARADAPTTFYYYESPVANFNLTDLLPGLPLTYDTVYTISVQIRVKLAGFEAWSQFGTACTVRTPLAPESSLVECGETEYQVPAMTTVVYATIVSGATGYRFKMEGDGYDETFESATNSFTLNDFDSITPITLGGTYSVSVAVELYGSYTDFGKNCSIIALEAPARGLAPTTLVVAPFKATAYPNPFGNSFMIAVEASTKESINIKVYDMIGRLIEQRDVNTNEMEGSTLGGNYPSGVYNVVVTQGEDVTTLRVVKR